MTSWVNFLAEYLAVVAESKIVESIVSNSSRAVRTEILTLKIRVRLINGWQLDCWEKISASERRYSYHVFHEGQAIVRWDNAAHHAQLENFPHHQHIGGTILTSGEMDVAGVLAHLEAMM